MNNQFPPPIKKDGTSGKISGFPKLPTVVKPVETPVMPAPPVFVPTPALVTPPAFAPAPVEPSNVSSDVTAPTVDELSPERLGEPEEYSENEDGTVNVYLTEDEYKDVLDYEAALLVEDLTIEQVYTLASSHSASVRETLAGNPRTPESVLSVFVNDSDELVREALVSNPSVSDEIYEQLISDSSTFVKEALIENERTSFGQLRKIDPEGEKYIIDLLESKGI